MIGCSSPILATVAAGTVVGYSATLLSQLHHESSPLKITSREESWIGEVCANRILLQTDFPALSRSAASTASLTMAAGCLLSGVLIGKFGCKMTFFALNVCSVVGWVFFTFSADLTLLLIGRLVTGFSIGLLGPAAPIYMSEISQPSYRGLFLTTIGAALSLGIMIPHALGIYLDWQMIAAICGVLPFISYVLTTLPPESPAWLLRHNEAAEAEKAFTWFRGCDEEAMKEFRDMVAGQKSAASAGATKSADAPTGLLAKIRDKSFITPLLILMVYFGTLQLSGTNAVAFYTIGILKKSLGEGINEYAATIVVDVTRMVASVAACVAVKRYSRRSLTILSGVGTAASLLGLSLYLYLSISDTRLKSMSAIPLGLFTLYVLFVTVGLNPLAWTLTGELFPLRYRAAGSALVAFFNFACFFAVVKTSPEMFELFREHGVFLIYGTLCLAGTVVLMLYLPETRNKTLQEIEVSYKGKQGDTEPGDNPA